MAALTYSVAAVTAIRPLADPDVWWHLRTAQWIVEHKAVPFTDPFSLYGMNRPWIAYSWLFELILYGLYRVFGLFGILVYSLIAALAITCALHVLLARYEPRVPRLLAVMAVGLVPIAPLFWPRSYVLSILLFILELHVLLAVRESGKTRRLLLLLPLFVAWANVHIQFVYGLFVLGLAASEATVARWLPESWCGPRSRLPARAAWMTFVACLAMTLATPYHVWLYRPLRDHVTQVGTFDIISELHAPQFRDPSDWIMLGLILWAVFLLGRVRLLPVFPTALLAAGIFVSFRAVRDVWFAVIVALVVIVATVRSEHGTRYRLRAAQLVTGFVIVIAVIAGVAIAKKLSPRTLESDVRGKFPVAAAAAIEARHYPGPLFNHYDWGGYLMWRLPQLRVSMDGRANVYGPEKIWKSVQTWAGLKGWDSDPDLVQARLVIASPRTALAELLRRDARFGVAYEDDVATVFVAQQ